APVAANWALLLEYPIPRRPKRLDAVLLARDVIFCLEFKTADKAHSLQPQRQVEDYALDLRDFHEASRDRRIVPVVVVPKAAPTRPSSPNLSFWQRPARENCLRSNCPRPQTARLRKRRRAYGWSIHPERPRFRSRRCGQT